MKRFDEIVDFMHKMEGGFNNIANDPGGMTIFGISRRSHPNCKFWVMIDHSLTELELSKNILSGSPCSIRITNMIKQDQSAMDQIQSIYCNDYWVKSRAYALPMPLDALLMDSVFNSGDRAKKWVQRWAGVPQDGIIGPQTMAAIKACQRNPAELLQMRWDFMKTLPTFKIFNLGWARRLIALAAFCKLNWKPQP